MNFKIFRRIHFLGALWREKVGEEGKIEPDDLPLWNFSIVRPLDSFSLEERDR